MLGISSSSIINGKIKDILESLEAFGKAGKTQNIITVQIISFRHLEDNEANLFKTVQLRLYKPETTARDER